MFNPNSSSPTSVNRDTPIICNMFHFKWFITYLLSHTNTSNKVPFPTQQHQKKHVTARKLILQTKCDLYVEFLLIKSNILLPAVSNLMTKATLSLYKLPTEIVAVSCWPPKYFLFSETKVNYQIWYPIDSCYKETGYCIDYKTKQASYFGVNPNKIAQCNLQWIPASIAFKFRADLSIIVQFRKVFCKVPGNERTENTVHNIKHIVTIGALDVHLQSWITEVAPHGQP